jgi:hypothetical protein
MNNLRVNERQPLEDKLPDLLANNQKQALLRQGHATHRTKYFSAVFTAEGNLAPLIGKGRRPPYEVVEGSYYIEGWFRGRELLIKIWRFTSLKFEQTDGEWSVNAEWTKVNTFNRQGWALRLDSKLQRPVDFINSSIQL